MRADATRNREALLLAARQLFVEQGVDVPLEAVARAAGVGVATLYRRFPDRDSLLTAVALLSLTESRALAEAGLRVVETASTPDAAEQAWQDLMRSAARSWIGAHLLTLLRSTSPLADPELVRARRSTLAVVDRLLAALQTRDVVRRDVTSFEMWSLLLVVARPLPGVPGADAALLVHRHLQIVAEGLRPGPRALTGRPVTQQDAESTAVRLAGQGRDGHRGAAAS